jgi:PAS domain S-box-containing protein
MMTVSLALLILFVCVGSLCYSFGRRNAGLGLPPIGRQATAVPRLAPAQFAALLDAGDDAVVGLDREAAVTYWSAAAERLFGSTAIEALGRKLEDVLPEVPLDADMRARLAAGDAIRGCLARALQRAGGPLELEFHFSPLRGSDASTDGLGLRLRDVSGLRAAQTVASRAHARLGALLETATDGIHVLGERGELVFFSQSFARMLGYSPEELAGLNVADWSPFEDVDEFAETIPRLGDAVRVAETLIRRRDGAMLDVEVSTKSVILNGGVFLYRSARDVGERNRADREIRLHLQELERINKELDDFVYVASHDLRAPLRAIKTLAQWIIDDDLSVDAKTRDRLQLIQARAQRLSQLLDDVMTYARAGKKLESTGPEMSAAALTADIAVSLQVPAGYRILTDRSMETAMVQRAPLEQVMHNLIGNAIKHHDRNQGSVRLWAVDMGERYRFYVADDGPGIPEAYRESVFEMFTTLRPRDEVEASGMGLALVRKVVGRFGGQCGIQGSQGRGTCLWFDWPKKLQVAQL